MPKSTLSREPTAHTDDDLSTELPDVTSDVARQPTAGVDAVLTVHGPGDS